MSNKLNVFYDSRQVAEKNPSFSPSAGKPALVVKEWQKMGYSFQLMDVTPVEREDFYLVHEKKHVDEVLDLKRVNGFNNKSADVANSLYWTNGSMVSACLYALKNNVNTCSPTSGFHHAGFWRVDGFCTFNGLAIAAAKLRYLLPSNKKIGILDIDMHYGNGTDEILSLFKMDYVQHYTFGGAEESSEFWRGGVEAERWLSKLPSIVESFNECAIVLYQAGADPHMDDPFGGALSDQQLRLRDSIVFNTLKAMKIPCAWNLAGGYQTPIQKVLNIHNATMEECLKITAS